jgi:hypothetical protein
MASDQTRAPPGVIAPSRPNVSFTALMAARSATVPKGRRTARI